MQPRVARRPGDDREHYDTDSDHCPVIATVRSTRAECKQAFATVRVADGRSTVTAVSAKAP